MLWVLAEMWRLVSDELGTYEHHGDMHVWVPDQRDLYPDDEEWWHK